MKEIVYALIAIALCLLSLGSLYMVSHAIPMMAIIAHVGAYTVLFIMAITLDRSPVS